MNTHTHTHAHLPKSSPVLVSTLDLLPRLVDLDILVAMARDVQDVLQRVSDPGRDGGREREREMTEP